MIGVLATTMRERRMKVSDELLVSVGLEISVEKRRSARAELLNLK